VAPARVISVDGQVCQVQTGTQVDRASMLLEPDLQVGDWVLVNSGTVVRVLDEEQAAEMTRAVAVLFGDPEADQAELATDGRDGFASAGGGDEAVAVVAGPEGTGPAF
jgi:hydrogenase assembly chaperone HypC/HupF